MTGILLGVLAALSWSVHDLIVRHLADRLGPLRLALFIVLGGGLLLSIYVLAAGAPSGITQGGLGLSLALGAAYGMGIGGLYKAFGLGPVSVAAPLTAAYPALVVLWGVVNGLAPDPVQWLAVAATLAGAILMARAGPEDGGINAVLPGKLGLFLFSCALSVTGFAAAFVLGQRAAVAIGEFEAAWISRLTAFLVILPFAFGERRTGAKLAPHWLAIGAMSVLDVGGLVAVNASGHFPDRDFAALGVSTYGAVAVVLALIFLREKVSLGQWACIALIVAGVATLSVSQ